jgi:hypothetical protein
MKSAGPLTTANNNWTTALDADGDNDIPPRFLQVTNFGANRARVSIDGGTTHWVVGASGLSPLLVDISHLSRKVLVEIKNDVDGSNISALSVAIW